jgi:hypothetical protein
MYIDAWSGLQIIFYLVIQLSQPIVHSLRHGFAVPLSVEAILFAGQNVPLAPFASANPQGGRRYAVSTNTLPDYHHRYESCDRR